MKSSASMDETKFPEHINKNVYICQNTIVNSLDKNITLFKGIHPGFILARELKKRNLPKRRLALLIGEFPQLLGDITNGKRRINAAISIRLGKALGIDESFFSVLQAHYDIEHHKKKLALDVHPNLTLLRAVLFWDTDIKTIDWEKNKTSVVQRVFERGNDQEINEIILFYGKNEVQTILIQLQSLSTAIENKMKRYL